MEPKVEATGGAMTTSAWPGNPHTVHTRGAGFLLDAIARGFTPHQARMLAHTALSNEPFPWTIVARKGGGFRLEPWRPGAKPPKNWVYKQVTGEWNELWIRKNLTKHFG